MMQIYISLAFLFITNADGLQYQGKEFMIAFCEHRNGISVPSLNVINYIGNPVRINISMPRTPGLMKPYTSVITTMITLKLPEEAIQQYSSIKHLAVYITSNDSIVVNGFNTAHLSIGGFLALPVKELGTEYITVNHCQSNVCIIMIVGTVEKTKVKVNLKLASGFINFSNSKYKTGDDISLFVNRFQTVQLQSGHDMSGSRISSDHPVAVFVASDFTNVDFGEGKQGKDNMVEQLFPISALGTLYSVPSISILKGLFQLKVIAPDRKTKIKISNVPTFSVNRWQHVTKRLHSNMTHLIHSNARILVAIIINSYDYYNTSDSYVDGSICLLRPVDMLESVMNIGNLFKIRTINPTGKADVKSIIVLLVAEDTKLKKPSTYITGLFNSKSQMITPVLSVNVWMTGFQVGAMMNLPLYFVPNPGKGNRCADYRWVGFLSTKVFSRTVLINHVQTFRKECCI